MTTVDVCTLPKNKEFIKRLSQGMYLQRLRKIRHYALRMLSGHHGPPDGHTANAYVLDIVLIDLINDMANYHPELHTMLSQLEVKSAQRRADDRRKTA